MITRGRVDTLTLTMLVFWLSTVNVSAAPLAFSATFPGADGARNVTFNGTASGSAITGQVSIDGAQFVVVATVVDRLISGRIEANGQRLGGFSAKLDGDEVDGIHDLGGNVGHWRIPIRELPRPVRTLLRR